MTNSPYEGQLQINVISSLEYLPVVGATITVFLTGSPDTPIATLTTNISGETEPLTLPTPPLSLSLEPSEIQPYSEYNIFVEAEGYEPVYISGSELLADQLSLQIVRMNPKEITKEVEQIIIIPAHTLWGNFPPKIPEDEIKPLAETGEIVLSRVVIPEFVIVQGGNQFSSIVVWIADSEVV